MQIKMCQIILDEFNKCPRVAKLTNFGRSLGCAPCTGTIPSAARSVAQIIAELRSTKAAETSGRAQDGDRGMERLRKDGYM